MELQADSVQSVLFLTPGQHQEDAIQLWSHLFPGDSPDGFQRANPSPSLMSTATGERNGYNVSITAQVGRIDIVLNHPPSSALTAAGPPRISDVKAAAARSIALMKRMTDRVKVARLALVLDLAKTVARGSEGSELLALLPGFPFPANSSDVTVQFNSRKPFAFVPDMEMNRLVYWSSGQMGFIQNPATQGAMMLMSPFIGVKIDINTAPEFRPEAETLPRIADELLSESMAIYSDGLARFG